jgi:hypothetical protein
MSPLLVTRVHFPLLFFRCICFLPEYAGQFLSTVSLLLLQVNLSPEDLDALTDGRALCDVDGWIGPAEVRKS